MASERTQPPSHGEPPQDPSPSTQREATPASPPPTALPTPTERRLTVNGLALHLLEWAPTPRPERAPRPTVIALHGFLDLDWAWEEVGARIAAATGRRVVAPSLRGHGDSEGVGAGGYYHFLDYTLEVAELVDALVGGEATVAVIGHSMGGAIAAQYAGTFPARVERLAVLEGLGLPAESADVLPARVAAWVASVRAGRLRPQKVYPSVDAAAERLRVTDPDCPPAAALRIATVGTRAVAGGVVWKHDPLHQTRGPMPFLLDASRAFWRRVECPTLVVDGERSLYHAMLPAEEHAARRAEFRRARHATVPGAGHMMLRHQPAAVAALLSAFLDEE